MFTILFSNFPDGIKKEMKDICVNCGQILILEENAYEKIESLTDRYCIDCFFFWLDESLSTVNSVISRIRKKKNYLHTPVLFFSSKIEYLLSLFVQWKSCEFFHYPLEKEKKEVLSEMIQYYDELYRKIHFDTVFHCNISTSKEIFSVPFDDILFVESTMKKSVLHTKEGLVKLPLQLYRVRELLPLSFFVQTHRSFIVNIKNISYINKCQDPWVVYFFDSKETAYISRNYKKEISLLYPAAADCHTD